MRARTRQANKRVDRGDGVPARTAERLVATPSRDRTVILTLFRLVTARSAHAFGSNCVRQQKRLDR